MPSRRPSNEAGTGVTKGVWMDKPRRIIPKPSLWEVIGVIIGIMVGCVTVLVAALALLETRYALSAAMFAIALLKRGMG
jgi:hypothetical protein